MLSHERQLHIAEQLQKQGSVSTAELAQTLDVSTETIRRDLYAMECDGILTRVHGGAVLAGQMRAFDALNSRNQRNGDLKRQLSVFAAEFIKEGDCIGIDAGSTAISFAQVLKERYASLTVVTHSYDVFEILRDQPNFRIILCGGTYLPGENAFIGATTLAALDGLCMHKVFVFPSTVSTKYGICDNHQDLMLVQKKYMERADKIFVLADSTKFEGKALHKVCDLHREYCYITDARLPVTIRALYEKNGFTLFNGPDDENLTMKTEDDGI